MEFSPLDIRYQEFKRSMRGYAPAEVRDYLARLAEHTDGVGQSFEAIRTRVAELEAEVARFRASDEELKRAVVAAERISREMRSQAEREAEIIRAEAEAAKERTLREALEHLGEVQRELEALKREREVFIGQFRGMLDGYRAALDKLTGS